MNHYVKRGETHLKKKKGAATVEFALASMFFFTVFFAILDFGYLFLGNLSMQHAVREGARYAVTGRADLDPNPQGTAQDRCDAAIVEIKNQSMGFFDKVSPVVVFKTVNADGSITPVPANSCAAANQIIVITVNCTLPLLTPFLKPFFSDGNYTFSVSTTMKNEAF